MQDIVRVQVVYSQYQLSEPFKQYLSVIQSYEHNVDDSLPSIGQTQCQTAPTWVGSGEGVTEASLLL